MYFVLTKLREVHLLFIIIKNKSSFALIIIFLASLEREIVFYIYIERDGLVDSFLSLTEKRRTITLKKRRIQSL